VVRIGVLHSAAPILASSDAGFRILNVAPSMGPIMRKSS
jgi:hypothetical protein